ncbi:MAG: 50S ribosomal protein L25 [Candidatus Gygaella obscura]|nr:50S ribosomal protein L25 [Candidatus Gygaella obscura]
MEELVLEVSTREEVGKSAVTRIRNENFIPAVLYGKNRESVSIKVSTKNLHKLVNEGRLENALIRLVFKDKGEKSKPIHTLVKELQFEPVKDTILHIDFNEISMTENIKVKVPVKPKGEPEGVKKDGGSLEHLLWELDVECLPTSVPNKFEIDVSALKIGDGIHIRDIVVPEGVKILHEEDSLVFSVTAPTKEELSQETEAAEGSESAEPEVIKKKKESAEGEAGAEANKPEKKEAK